MPDAPDPALEQDNPEVPEAPETGQATTEAEESFIDDFNLEDVPEEARSQVEALQKQWQGSYTQKRQADRQEVEEARRKADEAQALIQGLSDPETQPHYLRLLGVDPTDPETLQRLGLQLDDDELELEPDPNERIGQLEQQIAQDREAREAAQVEQALDDFADTELETIESQWGRKLNEDEDAILRRQAENNPGPDGLPDYAGAAKMLKGILTRGAEEELKRRSEPGRGGPGGRPGGKALDVNKPEDRLEIGVAAAERALASQND